MHLDEILEHLRPGGPFQILTWFILTTFSCLVSPTSAVCFQITTLLKQKFIK